MVAHVVCAVVRVVVSVGTAALLVVHALVRMPRPVVRAPNFLSCTGLVGGLRHKGTL